MRSLLSGQTPVSLITSPEKHNIFFLKKLRGATSSEKWWGPLVLTWLPKDLFIRKLFFFWNNNELLDSYPKKEWCQESCGKLWQAASPPQDLSCTKKLFSWLYYAPGVMFGNSVLWLVGQGMAIAYCPGSWPLLNLSPQPRLVEASLTLRTAGRGPWEDSQPPSLIKSPALAISQLLGYDGPWLSCQPLFNNGPWLSNA